MLLLEKNGFNIEEENVMSQITRKFPHDERKLAK